MTVRVLLVEDDPAVRESTAFSLEDQGFAVVAAESGERALALVDDGLRPDLVLTDLRMPGISGIDLLRALRARALTTPVVVVTAYGSVERAVEAVQAGAQDFLEKPVGRETLRLRLETALAHHALVVENAHLKAALARGTTATDPVFASAEMRAVVEQVDRVAPTDVTVLLTGESGTGKEVLARRLHERSARRAGPFVAVNCSALPRDLLEAELFGHERGAFTGAVTAKKGRFVEADGGTLFLDEIGDLDPALQAKLLRVLQERVVDVVGGKPRAIDVRVVAASHRDLRALVADGRFREDLYFRLHVVPIAIPPLRARPDDIAPLFAVLVDKAARVLKREPPPIDPTLPVALRTRAWPGNVRELENVAMRLVAEHPGVPLTAAHLDVTAGRAVRAADDAPRVGARELVLPDDGIALAALERAAIVAALRRTGGNKSQAARFLRIPRHALLYRVEKLAIHDDELTPAGEARAPIRAVLDEEAP